MGSSLLEDQRGGHQDVTDNEGVGVLDLPGYLKASRQERGTTAGTEGERTGGQVGTLEVTKIIARRQAAMVEGIRRGHRVTFDVRPESGGTKAHLELVQAGVGGGQAPPSRENLDWIATERADF